jgi:hypothetical protein
MVERATAQPDAHGLPREAGGRQGRLLGPHVGFPNWGLRLQPATTGRPGCAPSGTKLGTRTPVEHSNGNRIRSLEGSRARISNPELLEGVPVAHWRLFSDWGSSAITSRSAKCQHLSVAMLGGNPQKWDVIFAPRPSVPMRFADVNCSYAKCSTSFHKDASASDREVMASPFESCLV